MATKIYYFSGEARWTRLVEPDAKFKRWSLDFYPDEESWTKYRESGLELKVRDDKEDKDVKYIQFSRPTEKLMKGKVETFDPPEVLDGNNKPLMGNTQIGNGSLVTCKVIIYDTPKGKGHRLEAVRADRLVPYIPTEIDMTEESPF